MTCPALPLLFLALARTHLHLLHDLKMPPEGRSLRDVTAIFWLQSGFMDLRKEKADRKEQLEKLETGFIQLSGATDGMSEWEARAWQGELRGRRRGPSV